MSNKVFSCGVYPPDVVMQRRCRPQDLPSSSTSWLQSCLSRISMHLAPLIIGPVGYFYHWLTKEKWITKLLSPKEPLRKKFECVNNTCSTDGCISKPIVVCLGDSLTEGALTLDWVTTLQQLYPSALFINDGIGGQTSAALERRVLENLDHFPDTAAITVLIGTNDIIASQNREACTFYMKTDKLPKGVDLGIEPFEENVDQILEALRRRMPKAKVAVISLPPIGFDLDSAQNRERLAAKHSAAFLDYHGELVQGIKQLAGPLPEYRMYRFFLDLTQNILLRMVLGSWDKVGNMRGHPLLFDCIHPTESGSLLLLKLVRPFLDSALPAKR
eukprot:jgi/Botrbrau1/9763/Bobra.85_1s0014.2